MGIHVDANSKMGRKLNSRKTGRRSRSKYTPHQGDKQGLKMHLGTRIVTKNGFSYIEQLSTPEIRVRYDALQARIAAGI